MAKDKIFVLLPDGIGLRNFAYTSFYEIAQKNNLDIIYWNATPFQLSKLGLSELQLPKPKLHPLTDIYKTARKHIELNHFKKVSNDLVYDTYKFPFSYKTLKNIFKSILTKLIIVTHNSDKGLKKVRRKIKKIESSSHYYKACVNVLKSENPKMVFCTNQRPSVAIAPLLAAKSLRIPTATFIFSWDNLPKATMVVETDYYFVWSELMKKQLLHYYSYIKEAQVFITGSPQFENHEETVPLEDKESFYKAYGLDSLKKYICYSGDDVTTCPDDPNYLKDLAKAVEVLNQKGYNLGIIFRRCPVDFSDRYDKVLIKYKNIITPIEPKWKRMGSGWNTIFPTKEDLVLQRQTIYFSEMVVNLGSSMVFDYTAYNKACAFINYDVTNKQSKDWSVKKIYNYVHFRSMPNNKCVVWLNNSEEIASKLEKALRKKDVVAAKDWFSIINLHPLKNASNNIINSIKNIID